MSRTAQIVTKKKLYATLFYFSYLVRERGGRKRDCFVEETYQDVPPLIVIKSNNSLVLRPNRAANAIASAADAI